MASSSYSNSPCAACKFLRRKCMPDCLFAPYFPPEEPRKFVNVHKIFGASNVSKILNEVQPYRERTLVNSRPMKRSKDQRSCVWLCWCYFGAPKTSFKAPKELDATNADLIRYNTCNEMRNSSNHHEGRSKMISNDDGGGSSPGLSFYYASSSANWNNGPSMKMGEVLKMALSINLFKHALQFP
ncbi:hypothetical protein ACSQ67_014503 [Phaseolus vulgaris]